jgi:hypothetical protein
MNNTTANNTPLTLKEANEIGGTIHELAQLSEKKIFETDDAAKKRAYITFLQDKLLLHANELLAAWFTMEQEYKPLLQSQATTIGHVLTILQRRNDLLQAAQKGPAPEAPPVGASSVPEQAPDNVVQLNATK